MKPPAYIKTISIKPDPNVKGGLLWEFKIRRWHPGFWIETWKNAGKLQQKTLIQKPENSGHGHQR